MISLFPYILGSYKSEKVTGRIECGWPNITREQCLARDCYYNNKANDKTAFDNGVNCFVSPHLGK